MSLTIFKPGDQPIRGIRSALKPPAIPDGYAAALSNLRLDTGQPVVRGGISTVSSSCPSTTCLGAWAGTLNGTSYVVSAWVVSSKVAVYTLNLLTGAFTEITANAATPTPSWGGTNSTSNGVAAGGTRFTLSTTAPVLFTVHTMPARSIGTAVIAPCDVLSISNGEDYPLIWNPLQNASTGPQLTVQKNLPAAAGASQFNFFARFACYLQVAGNSAAKTYTAYQSDGHTTQTRYVAADSSAAPYNSSGNYVPKVTVGAAVNKDNTEILFPAAASLPGEQGNFVAEGVAAGVADFFTNCKLEAGTDGTALSITSSSNATPCVVALGSAHGLVSADDGTGLHRVVVTGPLTGLPTGTYFAKAGGQDSTHLALYYDEGLTTGAPGTGGVGGTLTITPLYTIYDSASTDPAVAAPPFIGPFDALGTRSIVSFSLKNLPSTASRSFKYVRFTRNGSYTGTAYALYILALAGASVGGGFYFGTQFGMAYTDRYSFAESPGFIGTNIGTDLLANCGGPQVVSSASASAGVPGLKLPQLTPILYDIGFHIVNPATAVTLYGGLAGSPSSASGVPSSVDIYFQTPDQAAAGLPPFYWVTVDIWQLGTDGSGNKIWTLYSDWENAAGTAPKPLVTLKSENMSIAATFGGADRNLYDPNRELPSAYNETLPRCSAIGTYQQRTFAGSIKDTHSNYRYGSLYFSWDGQPFRFQQFATSEDSRSGSSLVFQGERIRTIKMLGAASAYAGIVYVATDKTWNGLGSSIGMFFDRQGSGFDANELSTRVTINNHGTNEPFTFADHFGVIFYVDQENQVMRFDQGKGESISRLRVDDKSRGVPAARRGFMRSVFWKDRYYLAYTPSGSSNTRLLGWNEVLKDWEFDDLFPSTVEAQQIVVAYDSSQAGGGYRMLLFSGGDQKVYGYEEGSTEPGSNADPLVRITTREYQSPSRNEFRFGSVAMEVDATSDTLTVDAYYRPDGTLFRGTVDLTNPYSAPQSAKTEAVGNRTQIVGGNPIVPPDSHERAEQSWSGYLDIYGHLPCAATIWRIESDMEIQDQEAVER